jgi:hypothetical protein
LQDGGDFSSFGIILQYEMMVDSVHGSWIAGGSVHHGPLGTHRLEATGARRHARRSLVSDRSRAWKLTGEGRVWRGEDGEADTTLTRAR